MKMIELPSRVNSMAGRGLIIHDLFSPMLVNAPECSLGDLILLIPPSKPYVATPTANTGFRRGNHSIARLATVDVE